MTGQHLRLFLAHLVELGFRDWGPAEIFAPDGTQPSYPGELVLTRMGMAEALRRLADYGEPYGNLFPNLIADFLDLPLQVLMEDGTPRGVRGSGEGEALYTIVLINEHYLATVRRPDDPTVDLSGGQQRAMAADVFSPGLIDASLADLDGLGEDDIGRVAAVVLRRRHEDEIVRAFGHLPPVQVARGRRWLRQAWAASRAVEYLTGDPVFHLRPGEQGQVLRTLTAGPARWAALRLLRAADDVELGELFGDGGGLLGMLEAEIPPGDVLRGELERFLEDRFAGGRELHAGQVTPQGQPAGEFRPELISPELAGFAVAQELTAEQARAVLEGRRDSELAGSLAGLPPVQRARAGWWLRRTRAAAGWADRALAYLTGDPAAGLNVDEQRDLVVALVTGLASPHERAVALVLLQAADDVELGELFGDGGGLLGVLEAGIPPGHLLRGDLKHFLEDRFAGVPGELQAGQVTPQGQPAGKFRPELISPELAGFAVAQELTAEQARAVLEGRRDSELAGSLAGLPPVQRARAGWWLRRTRAAAGWADRALAYLTGDPAAGLNIDEQQEVIDALLTGLASPDERWLALQLLQAADDSELSAIFEDAEEMLDVLDESIPPGHALHGELEDFLKKRFAEGRRELEAGVVNPQGQPAQAFSPFLLHPSLAGHGISAELDKAKVEAITQAIAQAIGAGTDAHWPDALMRLSPVHRARAARWLAAVRVAVHALGIGPPLVLSALDFLLNRLYLAAGQLPADRLRQVTVSPPSERAELLRDALTPAMRSVGEQASGGQAEPSTRQVLGDAEAFAAQLLEAYRDDIREQIQQYVTGRRRAEHAVSGNLYSMEHIGRIAEAARQWTEDVFGHLATGQGMVPDRPGVRGNIHDQWADIDRKIAAMSPDQRRAQARQRLLLHPTWGTKVTDVIKEHHALPVFDPQGRPRNDAAQIISAVIDKLLDEQATTSDLDEETILDQVLAISRGWSGQAVPETQDIWIQVFRAANPEENQAGLWRIALTLIHEYLHLREHPEYTRYRISLGFGTHAFNTLLEGVVSLLTEVVWSGVWPRAGQQAVRDLIEGEYANSKPLKALPHPVMYRYASMAEVMRLIHVVGSVQNLYAAFFLGDVEKITGPIGLAVMGSPRAPLSAGEVAALVARLNAMPAAERQQLRISLFSDATQEEIERLLTERGADILAVWTSQARVAATTGERLEEQWAPYAAQWSEVLDRLAGDAPAPNLDQQAEGFPSDRAQGFDLYRAARAEHDAAADRLAELERHTSGSPSPELRLLEERRQSAALRLSQAVRWLAAWGISDPDAAARAAEEFSRARASGLAGGAPRRPLPDGEGSGLAEMRLDGGFVSVADTVLADLEPWLRDRLRVPGVFDLALSGSGDVLGGFGRGGFDQHWDADELARRLPGWGATDGDVIRLVTPGGARLEGMLAQLRGRPVLRTPLGSRAAAIPASWDGQSGADIAPVGLMGDLVPWRVTWPQDSWEHQQGRPMIAEAPFNAFVVGLHAGSEGLMLLHNRLGSGFASGQAGPDHLRALGWDGRQDIVLVTRHLPAEVIDTRLRELGESLGVAVNYRLPHGFASVGAASLVDRLELLRPEPGLFDLLLERRADSLPNLLRDRPEVRLVMAHGEQAREEAVNLARELDRPVWVTPDGAMARVRDDGRLMAIDQQTGEPVAWVQIMPRPVPAEVLPWYDTSSGVFQPQQGDAVIELRREPAGEVSGIVLTAHDRYIADRMAAARPRSQAVGLYAVSVEIDRDPAGFLLHSFAGGVASRPLRELPRLLEAHGWTPGQHILIATDFSDFADEGDEVRNQRWDAITEAFAQIARDEAVSVFFPARGSSVRTRYMANELAVTGAADPRLDRRDPPGQLASLVQDPAGRLRPATGFVSLTLRSGVASPDAELIRARSLAYEDEERSADGQVAFVVDVPLADGGHLGLVFPDGRGSESGWRAAPASTAQVVDLIRGGGYQEERQVLQFLAAPRTPAEYKVFVREAQEVANQLGHGVYVVGAAGATVAYRQDRHVFAVRGDDGAGTAVGWRWLESVTAAEEARPPLVHTDADGALARSVVSARDRRLRVFGNLITFESAHVIDGYVDVGTGLRVHGERLAYQAYATTGGGLPIVVVPTREGRPVDPAGARLPAHVVANVVRDLASLDRQVLTEAGWTPGQLGRVAEPVRLLARPQDDVEPADQFNLWAGGLAGHLGVTVYLASAARFSTHFRDYAADDWLSFEPGEPHDRRPAPAYVMDAVTGRLVPEDLGANPLRRAQAALPGDLVTEQFPRGLVLPGPGEVARLGEEVPEDQFVVVAHGAGGTIMGLTRRPGDGGKGEMVPVPPSWLAGRIQAADGYAPGRRVIFLVPGLGLPWPEASLPEHYGQQVANLLRAPVEAIVSATASRSLSQGRTVFRPRPPILETRVDEAGGTRLLSLPPRWHGRADAAAAATSAEVQVFLPAFSDGSLGLYYPGQPGEVRVYPVSPPLIAAALAPVLAGRSFAIRPLSPPGEEISQVRLEATLAAVQAQVLEEAPPYHDFDADGPEPTPSGFYLRAEGAGGVPDGPQDRAAAQAFPPVENAVVVHVHTDPESGQFAVGGRLLTAAEFQTEVVPLLRLTTGQLLVLVACGLGAAREPGALAAAGALAYFGGQPVLAASGDVFTTPAGEVEVRAVDVNEEGQPALVPPPVGWQLFRPRRVAPVAFGPNLAAVLADPRLAGALPEGASAPALGQHQEPRLPPTDDVGWNRRGLVDHQSPRRGVRWNGDFGPAD